MPDVISADLPKVSMDAHQARRKNARPKELPKPSIRQIIFVGILNSDNQTHDARNTTAIESQHVSWSRPAQRLYNMPAANTADAPNFCLLPICRPHTEAMGRINMVKSEITLMIAATMIIHAMRTQCPSVFGIHILDRGVHSNILIKVFIR